jgi:hypothetical protein
MKLGEDLKWPLRRSLSSGYRFVLRMALVDIWGSVGGQFEKTTGLLRKGASSD